VQRDARELCDRGGASPSACRLQRPAECESARPLGLRQGCTNHGQDSNPGIRISTMVVLRSAAEIETLREAGRVVARTLAAVGAAARPGVRLLDLDALAAEHIASAGAKPNFLGYQPSWAPAPYPGVVCLSVNEAIVHGIPDARVLTDGDLLS